MKEDLKGGLRAAIVFGAIGAIFLSILLAMIYSIPWYGMLPWLFVFLTLVVFMYDRYFSERV